MAGNDQPEDGAPKRKGKAAAMRGPNPRRRKRDDEETENAETSKGAAKKKKDNKDVSDEIRNRATPWRIAHVNDMLIGQQKVVLIDKKLGGLLNIATSMPVDLSQWVMRCYDPHKSELIIPDRGRIPVDAESVSRMWGVPSSGMRVCWDVHTDVIKTVNKDFGFEGSTAPDLTSWCKKIKEMGGAADDKFVQAYYMVAYSCFFAPTTSVKVCARCYTVCQDPALVDKYNIAQFVVDQIRQAFMSLGTKKSVCCCVYHLLLLYLDSLDVDELISDCTPRANAWDSDLISKVLKKDRLSPGVLGKLQLKEKFRDTAQGGLFGGLLTAEQFVAATLPPNYDHMKKRKLAAMVHGFCTDFEESMRKWVGGIGSLDEAGSSGSKHRPSTAVDNRNKKPVKRPRKKMQQEEQLLPEGNDDADTDNENSEDTFILHSDDSDEDEQEDESDKDDSDEDADKDKDDGDDDSNNNDGNGGRDGSSDDDDGNAGGKAGGGGGRGRPDTHVPRSESSRPVSASHKYVYEKRKGGDATKKGKNKEGSIAEDEPGAGDGNDEAMDRNHDDGRGCDNNATVPDEHPDAQDGELDRSVPIEQLVNQKSDGRKAEASAKYKEGAAAQGPISLLDMCRMEIPRRLPDIPILEEIPVWDETPSFFMRNLNLDSIMQPIPTHEGEQPNLDGLCTPSAYNDWFEVSHGLRASVDEQAMHPATFESKAATTVLEAEPSTPKLATQTTGQSPQATVHANLATATRTEANDHSTHSAAPVPAIAQSIGQKIATKTTRATNQATNHRHNASVPSPSLSKATTQATAKFVPSEATDRSLKKSYITPSSHNCPPPVPAVKEPMIFTLDETYEMLTKLSSTTSKSQNLVRTKSAESNHDKGIDTVKLPIRCNSGGKVAATYCDPPCFSLGLDWDTLPEESKCSQEVVGPACTSGGPAWDTTPGPTNLTNPAVGTSCNYGAPKWDMTPGTAGCPAVKERGDSIVDDEFLEACLEVEKKYRSKVQEEPASNEPGKQCSNFHTPAKLPEQVEGGKSAGSKSSSGPELHARRIIKPPSHLQPMMNRKYYNCTEAVNKLYALVLLHGRRPNTRQIQQDISPHIVNFGDYHITLRELADSMKPGGWIHTSVMEIGIQFLNSTTPSSSNKVIMPLRIATHMQNMDYNGAEIKNLFSKDKRLDKKDMVMFPVLQPLNPKAKVVVHHYFLFTINIRDRKFQVLDSWRTLEDKLLKDCVNRIKATAVILWDESYSKSKVHLETFRTEEINVPRQITNDDCGVCTLMNAELWEGRFSSNYTPKDLPNIRKIMTTNWITSMRNTVDWNAALKQ